jgi:hypothetical protein
MALDDFFDSEVAIAAGLTAAVLSRPVRRVMRRGAVLGLAGIMTAGDALAGAARGAMHEAQASRDGGGSPATPPGPTTAATRSQPARADT